ncbi:hypothetical protein FOZ62_002746 [Perkinsus olseni]|uniref:Uncharacterized protein n=1 Tax=Perkinsus olseni TaxID=32597 RepID=A0A7J6R7F0_PEROL|nr:hypothetical protein FOZ62_002746 [Perkinsus olseni]
MNPFLCSTVALESAAVKSRFRRYVSDGARFLNDVGREVSAFLGKSSRELTFNCPCTTVMLPEISFMFIRHGVLTAALHCKTGFNLVPVLSPAATPHLRIISGEGYMQGHCYDPVKDTLYILYRNDDAFLLHVHRLTDEFEAISRVVVVEGMLDLAQDISNFRGGMASAGGRLYLPCSGPVQEGGPFSLVCLDARNSANGRIQAQMVWNLSDSCTEWPMSLICEHEGQNGCILSVVYCAGDEEEWVFRKLLITHSERRVSVECLCSWLLEPHDGMVVDYQLLKKNLLLLCSSGDGSNFYYYSLCDQRGRELGEERGQLDDFEPVQTLVSDDGTIYIKSGFTQTIHNPVDCIHAFYTQARHLMHTKIRNWFFDNKYPRINPVA